MNGIAMMRHVKPMHWGHALGDLVGILGLMAMASCSPGEPTSGAGHIEYAGNQVPEPPATFEIEISPPLDPGSNPPISNIPVPPSSAQRQSPSFFMGRLSPLDWAIRNDCPARPWSKNVPERVCTEDRECGDGFCDRGRCAAIWTCDEHYGQRCYGPRSEKSGLCDGLCIEGRCRTCLSDDECTAAARGKERMCNRSPTRSGGRRCVAFNRRAYDP